MNHACINCASDPAPGPLPHVRCPAPAGTADHRRGRRPGHCDSLPNPYCGPPRPEAAAEVARTVDGRLFADRGTRRGAAAPTVFKPSIFEGGWPKSSSGTSLGLRGFVEGVEIGPRCVPHGAAHHGDEILEGVAVPRSLPPPAICRSRGGRKSYMWQRPWGGSLAQFIHA